jgi:ubiquinone/menaquinone biosynthesis C-methylase UbiE
VDQHQQAYAGSYEKQAVYYDAIYAAQGKDYQKEAEQIHEVIKSYKRSSGSRLLDVGCGTGGHFGVLKDWYGVEGLDIDAHMLNVARQRFPGVAFHAGDMVDFQLPGRFDAITCLFSAIGYTRTLERMRAAVRNMGQHLAPGGVLVVEPWFGPDQWVVGKVHAAYVDRPDLKIARINISEREGSVSTFTYHFLVGSEGKVESFTERHELGLFTEEEYRSAFEAAGLEVALDKKGITGRGLYVGVKAEG